MGIDGKKSLMFKERVNLVNNLVMSYKVKFICRIWIFKLGKIEKRFLGILIIFERVK